MSVHFARCVVNESAIWSNFIPSSYNSRSSLKYLIVCFYLHKLLTFLKRINSFVLDDRHFYRMNRGTTPAESTDRPGPSSARTPITPRLERLLITEEEEHLVRLLDFLHQLILFGIISIFNIRSQYSKSTCFQEESMTQGHFPETPRLKRKALQTEFDRELEAVVRWVEMRYE